MADRRAGVLCHITSLPGEGAVGTLGPDAFTFVDLLAQAGVTVWQMLPVTPPDQHSSPYASTSAFAGWTDLCDPSLSVAPDDQMIATWLSQNAHWAWDWALYDALKAENDGASWTKWPEPIRHRQVEALQEAGTRLAEQIRERIVEQVRFHRDWMILRHYAAEKGVRLFGDLPIFVAHDSADVWTRPHLFQLDEDGQPSVVAGVPPDYFSENGQRWGTVLYEWDAHKAEDWTWWRLRMARICEMFDMVRIDHFRGFESAWAIPSSASTAKQGEWQDGPGADLLFALTEVAGPVEIVAEDLGVIPESVNELRRSHGLPGMAVLHFAYDDENPHNPHRPENIKSDQIAYTGTHDNDTTMGWWQDSSEERKHRVNSEGLSGESPCDTLIRLAAQSPAPLAIIPMQDILELGKQARMNSPGTTGDNWSWRFDWGDISAQRWDRFAQLVKR